MELYTRYTLTTKMGLISYAGVIHLTRFLNGQNLQDEMWKAANPDSTREILPPLPEDWEWVWTLTKGAYRGTLPKRISAFYAKMHSIKCPTKFLTEIGNIGKSHATESETYHFEFVDEIDWYAGEFGENDDSCYWNQYAGARRMITDNGGLAVRFYDEHDNGIARAWLAEIGTEMYVLWNGYGFSGNATLVIARIVAIHLKLTYKKIELLNRRTAYSTLYINNSIGYLIGTQAQIEPLTRHDLNWTEINVRVCYECGDEIDEDDSFTGADDHAYCQRCYERLFDTCGHCGETYWLDDLTYTDYEIVCYDCRREYYVQCDECGEYVRKVDIHDREEGQYCENCVKDD